MSNYNILDLINEYLQHGGLFNPESMDHDKVRDLIIRCRDEIERLQEIEWMYNDLQD